MKSFNTFLFAVLMALSFSVAGFAQVASTGSQMYSSSGDDQTLTGANVPYEQQMSGTDSTRYMRGLTPEERVGIDMYLQKKFEPAGPENYPAGLKYIPGQY